MSCIMKQFFHSAQIKPRRLHILITARKWNIKRYVVPSLLPGGLFLAQADVMVSQWQ